MFENEDEYYDRLAEEYENPRDYEEEARQKELWAEEYYGY